MDTLLIKNVNIVGENEILSDSDIRVREGKIAEIGRGLFPEPGETVADFGGCYAAPGFIDMHVHGGNGSDFMDATEADFENIASFHAAHGTTSMLATTLAAADEELLDALHCFNGYVERPHAGANLLGLHLEGPYFSYEQRGAQDPKYLLCPTKSHYRKFMDASPHIKRWSAAPELEGTAEFAAECRNRGILLSAAHSSCTAAEALEALREGFGLITHFYSGMNGVIRRNSFRIAGLVEAGYLYDGFRVELIADGCHLPAELLSLVLKVKGEKNIALITDCTSAAGLTSPPLHHREPQERSARRRRTGRRLSPRPQFLRGERRDHGQTTRDHARAHARDDTAGGAHALPYSRRNSRNRGQEGQNCGRLGRGSRSVRPNGGKNSNPKRLRRRQTRLTAEPEQPARCGAF